VYSLLRRLLGRNSPQDGDQERFSDNLKRLEESEKELDKLGYQLEEVERNAKSKQVRLVDDTQSFTRAVGRSMTPPQMRAFQEKMDEQAEKRNSSIPADHKSAG